MKNIEKYHIYYTYVRTYIYIPVFYILFYILFMLLLFVHFNFFFLFIYYFIHIFFIFHTLYIPNTYIEHNILFLLLGDMNFLCSVNFILVQPVSVSVEYNSTVYSVLYTIQQSTIRNDTIRYGAVQC